MAEAIQLSPGGALTSPPPSLFAPAVDEPTQTLDEAIAEAQQQPTSAAPISSLQQTQAQLQNPQNVDWVAQLQQNQAKLQQRNVPRTYAPAVDAPLTDVGPAPERTDTGGFGTAVAGSFLNSLGSLATGTGALIRKDPVSNLALTAAANFQSLLQGKGQTPDWLAPAQQGLRAVNEPAAAPFEAAGKSLREAGGKQFEQLAPELKAAFNASIAGTDLFGGAPDPKTGKIPTPSDVGWGNYAEANAAGLLGWFASLPLPVGVFGRTLGAIAKTGVTVAERAASAATIRNTATNIGLFTAGGAQAVGGVYEKLVDEVSKVPDQELQEKSPQYKELRKTMDETQARQAAVDASMPTLLTFVTGGAANLALGQALPGVARGSIFAPTTRLGAAGLGAAEGGAGMGLGAGSAEAATQYGEKAMGLRERYDPGRIALGAGLGFAGGAAMGGGVGAVMGGHAPAKAIPTVDPAVAAAMAASTKPAEPTTPADFGIGAPPAAEPAPPVIPTPPIPPRQPFAPTPRPVQQEPTRPGDFGIGAPPAQPTTPGDFGIGAPPTAPRDFAAEGRPQSAPPPTPPPPPPLAPGDFAISRPPVAETPPLPPPAAAAPVGPPRPAPFDIPAREIPTRPKDFGVGAPPPEPPPPPPMTAPEQFGIGRPPGSEAPPAPPGPPRPQPFPAGGRAIEVSLPTRPEDFGVGAPERAAPTEAIPTREAAPAATPSPFEGMNRDQLLNVATRAGMPAEALRGQTDAQIRSMLDEALTRGQEQRVTAEGAAPAGETAVAARTEAQPAGEAAVAVKTETAPTPTPTPAPITRAALETRLGELGLSKSEIRKLGAKPKLEAEVQRLEAAAGKTEELPTVGREGVTGEGETPIAALRTTEGVTVQPDDVNKGRFVAKNPAGEVIGKGLSEAEARADAYYRRGEPYKEEAPPAKPGLVKIAEARARQAEKVAAARATREAAAAERAAAEAEVVAQRRQQEQAETQAKTTAAETRRSREIAEEGPAGQRKVPERGTTQAERDAAREGAREDSVTDDAWLDRERDRADEVEIPARAEDGTQPLAASVTETRKIGRNIVKRYKEGEFADDPAAAADAFPTRPDTPEERAKGGQKAAHKSLVDYLDKEIARLEDPAAEQELIAKAAELQNTHPANQAEGNKKARRSASLNLEMRQFDLENIEALKTMREEVSQALASRDGKTLNAPPAREQNQRSGPWGTRRGVTVEQLSKPVQDAFEGRDSTSIHSLLSAFSNNSYVRSHAPQLASFARWLQNALPQTLMAHRNTGIDAPARYSYGGGREDRIQFAGQPNFEHLIHEASHGVVSRFIEQLQPGSREARVLKLFEDELTRVRDAGNIDPDLAYALDYALKDWHELHTMLGTSPDLYQLLSQFAGSPQFKAGLAALGYADKSRTLWQSLVKVIRRGLGMPQSFTNIMDHALRPVQDIYTAAHEYNLANLDRSVWTMADPNALEKLHGAFQNEITQNIEAQQRQLNAPNPVSYVRQQWDESALTKRGPWDWMRPKLLHVMTDYGISKYYEPLFTKDGRSLLTVAREIRDATQNLQREEYKRIEPTVLDLSARLRDNKPVSTLLVDATRAEARLYSTDPEANAHLTTKEQQDRLTELKAEYAKLTPEGQKLYRDTTSFLSELYAKEREAKLDGVVGVIAPEAPQAARDQLKAELRTEGGIKRILASAKTSDDLAAALAIPGTLVRAIAQFHNMGFVRGDYFPLRRFGEYVLINGDRQSSDYSVQMFERRSEAEAARKEMASARDDGNYLYPDLQQITTKKQITDRRGADLANPILDELNNRVTAHYGADQAKAIHDMLTSIMLQHMTRSEATRTRLRRQGVEGASYDAARVIASDAQAATWRIGYYTHGLERARTLRDMEVHVSELQRGITPRERELQAQIDQVTTAGGDATALRQELTDLSNRPRDSLPEAAIARQVLNEEIARQPAADDPSQRAWGQRVGKATQLTYVHSLLSLSNAIVNTVEAHAAATAFIGARHGFASTGIQLGRAVAEMLPEGVRQMKELGQRVLPMWEKQLRAADWDISKVMFNRLDFPHKEALRTAARAANLIDAGGTLSRSMRQIANPGMVSGTKLGRGWDMFMDMSSILGHVSEEASKIAILKVAFEMEMKKNNNNVDKSITYALNELEKALPNYRGKARIATPQGALGQMGPATMQFRNYGFHITSVLATLGKQAMRGENASEARWALSGLFMMHAGLAGAFNWLADPLRILGGAWDLATGEKRPYAHPALEAGARSFATKMLGPTIAEMVGRGLPHAGGYGGDLGHRLGLANVFNFPDLPKYGDPNAWVGAIGGIAIGAPGAAASDIASAAALLGQGRFVDAAKKFIPRVGRDIYQAGELYTQGIKDPQGRTIMPPERLPVGAVLTKAIGINPAAVAEFREQRGNMTMTRQRTEDIRHDILNSYAQAKNRDAMNAVMRQVKVFNTDIGKYAPIGYAALTAQTRDLARSLADPSAAGLNISPRRRDIYDAGGAYNFPGRRAP